MNNLNEAILAAAHDAGQRVSVIRDGVVFWADPQPDPAAIAAITSDAQARLVAHQGLQHKRRQIAKMAGDQQHLLGMTSDASSIALVELAKLLRALSEAQSLAEMRDAAEAGAALLGPYLASVEAGAVVPPYTLKGTPQEVLTAIGDSATKVSEAISEGGV